MASIDHPLDKTYAELHDELTEQGHATPDAVIWDVVRSSLKSLQEVVTKLAVRPPADEALQSLQQQIDALQPAQQPRRRNTPTPPSVQPPENTAETTT